MQATTVILSIKITVSSVLSSLFENLFKMVVIKIIPFSILLSTLAIISHGFILIKVWIWNLVYAMECKLNLHLYAIKDSFYYMWIIQSMQWWGKAKQRWVVHRCCIRIDWSKTFVAYFLNKELLFDLKNAFL